MVLRREGRATIAIGQPSHAWLSGQLARAWGNERFGAVEPWEEVCLAAEQHDAGMAAWDVAPTLNPSTGLPHSFMEMPLEDHLDLWAHAYERLLPQSRYAALLISLHGTSLYEARDLGRLEEDQVALVRRYLDSQHAIQDELRSALGADPAALPELVERNRRLVWTWDAFSLALCLGWPPNTLRGVPAADGDTNMALSPGPGPGERPVVVDPWPFAVDRLSVRCEGRRLDGHFRDEPEMRAALAAAPWVALEFDLAPGAAPAAST